MPSSNPLHPQEQPKQTLKVRCPPGFYRIDGTYDEVREWIAAIVHKHSHGEHNINPDPAATQQALTRMRWDGRHLLKLCMKFKLVKMEAELRGLGLNPRLAKVVREEAIARFLISKERVDRNFNKVIMMKGELFKFLFLISASIRRKLRNVCYARFPGLLRFCCKYREYKLVCNLQIS
jgi:hypothetical protein